MKSTDARSNDRITSMQSPLKMTLLGVLAVVVISLILPVWVQSREARAPEPLPVGETGG
jgi:hypothetical protein